MCTVSLYIYNVPHERQAKSRNAHGKLQFRGAKVEGHEGPSTEGSKLTDALLGFWALATSTVNQVAGQFSLPDSVLLWLKRKEEKASTIQRVFRLLEFSVFLTSGLVTLGFRVRGLLTEPRKVGVVSLAVARQLCRHLELLVRSDLLLLPRLTARTLLRHCYFWMLFPCLLKRGAFCVWHVCCQRE